MIFCPVVPEICHGQVHGPRKERRKRKRKSKNNKSPKLCLGDLIISVGILELICFANRLYNLLFIVHHIYHYWPWFVCLFCLIVFNATFTNISAISWTSVLLVDETGGSR